MEKAKKIKLFIGLFYLTAICLFLYFFFSKFSLQEITSYDFIRENRSYFFELKNSNLFLLSIVFLGLTILWVFPFLGFGSPVALIRRIYFWKMDWNTGCCFGIKYWRNFYIHVWKFFFKRINKKKIFKQI